MRRSPIERRRSASSANERIISKSANEPGPEPGIPNTRKPHVEKLEFVNVPPAWKPGGQRNLFRAPPPRRPIPRRPPAVGRPGVKASKIAERTGLRISLKSPGSANETTPVAVVPTGPSERGVVMTLGITEPRLTLKSTVSCEPSRGINIISLWRMSAVFKRRPARRTLPVRGPRRLPLPLPRLPLPSFGHLPVISW